MHPFDIVYDIETLPNCFTLTSKRLSTGVVVKFEISDRMNQLREMCAYLAAIRDGGGSMIGFNNIGFDYPVVHFILNNRNWVTVQDIYAKSQEIINAPEFDKFAHIIWDNNQLIPQVDLFKIHHFDNPARRTGLKQLEFGMVMESIDDLPFHHTKLLTDDEKDKLLDYNEHDVEATALFYNFSKEELDMRVELTQKFGRNFMNMSGVKIGTTILTQAIEQKNPEACFEWVNGKRKPRQTWRASIPLNQIIFPYVKFEHSEFKRVHEWLLQQTIIETKGAFENLSATINDFTFWFGTGGLHGSVESCCVTSDEETAIIDIDAVSFYPSLSIVNNVYPDHIGPIFCEAYRELKAERLKHKKGSAINTAYKLALNGTFGNTNNDFSCFLDSWFTMKITVNGQLLLCMLAEQLIKIPSLQMIQANTDGITVQINRSQLDNLKLVTDWWQKFTCLDLEQVEYSRMWIRDVNNYIAEKTDGKLKRKGAYCNARPWEKGADLEWHKDHSMLVVKKAAEAALVRGINPRDFIMAHNDMHDFMIRARATGKSRLVHIGYDGGNHELSKTVRYYVSKIGYDLVKVMPPLAGKNDERFIGECAGRKTIDCSKSLEIDRSNIDYEFYIQEAKKLIDPCLKIYNSDKRLIV